MTETRGPAWTGHGWEDPIIGETTPPRSGAEAPTRPKDLWVRCDCPTREHITRTDTPGYCVALEMGPVGFELNRYHAAWRQAEARASEAERERDDSMLAFQRSVEMHFKESQRLADVLPAAQLGLWAKDVGEKISWYATVEKSVELGLIFDPEAVPGFCDTPQTTRARAAVAGATTTGGTNNA